MDNQLQTIIKTYLPEYDGPIEQITGSGSNRIYLRLYNKRWGHFIAVYGSCTDENRAFVNLARHFASKGLPVPHLIEALSEDAHFYLQEDVGRISLYDALSSGRAKGGIYDEKEQHLLHQTIAYLPAIQFLGGEGLEGKWCYPKAEFDKQGIMFDLNYFKYCFLKATINDLDEVRLEEEFNHLADKLLEKDELPWGFLYRDFQARNVMLTAQEEPRFIDFQGGRKGPVYYDIASFLWQAASQYPQELRESLINTYMMQAKTFIGEVDKEKFHKRLQLFVLFRLMQVLGAYGFRGYFERKSHFLTSIPPAINNLRELLCQKSPLWNELSYLKQILESICRQSRFASPPQSKELVVRVFSFSYKKGIPDDLSGNGGGYVFDCRSTHNPGRYEPYKKLTGLDKPVIDFLETDGEILTFLDHIYKLADTHVERYIERGFTNLMFSFGCTGGQHRSVYSAEHLAIHLHEKFGVTVELVHREQGIKRVLRKE